MKDVQNMPPDKNIRIDKVGIKGLRYPIVVLDKANQRQSTVAEVNMFVELPEDFKGTHMSRFVEILNDNWKDIQVKRLKIILKEMKGRLNAPASHIVIKFPYFIEKKAPVTEVPSLMSYDVTIYGSSYENIEDFIYKVEVPVTSLCPCSKEISDYGAHNQRSIISLSVRTSSFMWLEDLIRITETSASCELFTLLKREDEKYVTEHAYDNPMFVEDIVRTVAEKCNNEEKIVWYAVSSENFESIHNHNAFAYIERWKDEKLRKKLEPYLHGHLLQI